ncbi:MAG: hypothetical protein COA54_11120 [Thiotrichaceae bacterium]|nr:MAG: hypothetical protein COA54_11120 [Thiotrichaceae bacterium]
MNNPLSYLPTDNLYKFMALSGVAIAISSAYLFVSKVYEYKDNLLAHKAELSFISPVTQAGVAVGTVLAGLGFYLWYVRIQQPLDKEIKAKAEIAIAQTRKDREDLYLSKYQKIYEELTNLENHVNMMNMQMIGDIGYGRKFNAKEIPTNLAYSSLKMNVDFHTPELSSDIQSLDAMYLEFGTVIGEFILKINPTEKEKGDFIVNGTVLTKKIAKEIKNLKSKLKTLANASTKIV